MVHIIDHHFLNFPSGIASFLIESSEGPILIETGPYSTFPRLEAGLQALGYKVQDIRHVLLTHIHFDHAGAAWAFAAHGAQIYVHPFGAKHLIDPTKLLDSARRIYKDQMDILWGKIEAVAESQITALKHEQIIRIGSLSLKALYTPGHAVHHIAFVYEDAIFTGDVGGVKILDGPVMPPCPPPDINIEDWKDSIAILKAQEAKTLYLTHYGATASCSDHWEQLEQRLDDWGQWILEKMESNQEMPTMLPAFKDMVQKQLIAAGVPDEHLPIYEVANPASMSVPGLMRYWKKKQEASNS